MKVKRLFSKKRRQKGAVMMGTTLLVLIIGLISLVAFFLVGGDFSNNSSTGTEEVAIVTPKPNAAKSNLQLYTFGYVTPTIPIKKSCGPLDDDGKLQPPGCKCIDLVVNCKDGKATDDSGKPFTIPRGNEPEKLKAGQNPCGTYIAPGNGRYCVAKPVIYLYPTSPTLVNVSVVSSGKIVVSDPLYPQGGWKNVLAYPNGNLVYQGKKYVELFYESEVGEFKKPEKGIIIKTDQLTVKLDGILDQLGLIGSEKKEFLDFWVPRLQALNSPYIFFSLIDKSEKDKLDKVSIMPVPDTTIEFLAYFKPINTLDYDNSLQLPPKPQRTGFVSVEWGGSLDTN